MSEQREALAEVLRTHRFMPCSETTPTIAVWWAQCEGCDWKGPRRSQRHSHEADHRAHVVDFLARLLADADQRGADRVAAALLSARVVCPVHGIPDCGPLLNGCQIPRYIAEWRGESLADLRAALTTGAADRVRAEAQVDFSRLNYGICPKCGEDKFIGHGPWCIDCFAGGGA